MQLKKYLGAFLIFNMVLLTPGTSFLMAEGEDAPPPPPPPAEVVETPAPTPEPTQEQAPVPEVSTSEVPTENVGEDGTDGTDGGQDPAPEVEEGDGTEGDGGDNGDATTEPPAVIVTGDAQADGTAINQENTNDVTTTSGQEAATSTSNGGHQGPPPGWVPPPPPPWMIPMENSSTTIDLANTGTASTTLDVGADTGLNTVAGNASSSGLIQTGNAVATANVINVVNTNIINSYGFLLFLNHLYGEGTFDLRDLGIENVLNQAANGIGGAAPCNFFVCSNPNTNINISNDGTIDNAVVVRSNTGGNDATGDGSIIDTGDAYAVANVLNLANTNIIDSNYLLISMNHFGDYTDDIVLPNMDFFQWFLNGTGISGFANILADNNATINNNIDSGANTGGNALDGEGGIIDTGNAYSSGGATNIVNTNSIGGNSVYILVRVEGDWAGDIFNLPEGLAWEQTADGIAIYSAADGLAKSASNLNANIANNALINNNISVYALTGENQIDGDGGIIKTGNAYSAANVFNMVNTNVVGKNWLYAAINIMGNWDGNFSFGRPDLWVGGRAESTDNQIRPGSPLTYHFTVTNFGDAVASNVKLTNDLTNVILNEGESWEIGTLAPGETREITRTGRVRAPLQAGEHPVTLTTTATAKESDNNKADNTESISLMAIESAGSLGGGVGGIGGGGQTTIGAGFFVSAAGTKIAPITIKKTASVNEVTVPATVEYTIKLKNEGPSVYKSVLVDKLVSEATGKVAKEQAFEIGTIGAGETIEVKYTMAFTEKSAAGMYANMAQLGAQTTDNVGTALRTFSPIAEAAVKVNNIEKPKETFLDLCSKYISKYMRYGANNDSEEVKKLQTFLKNNEGMNEVDITGQFDLATRGAVKAFQDRYKSDVLSPWGVKAPTGYVYYTTQKKINEIYCAYNMSFPLSSTEQTEIDAYKATVERARLMGQPAPATGDIGKAKNIAPQMAAIDLNTSPVTIQPAIQSAINSATTQIQTTQQSQTAGIGRVLLRATSTSGSIFPKNITPNLLRRWFQQTLNGHNQKSSFIMTHISSR